MIKSCLLFALIAGVAVADNICCQAITAECRACNKGLSVSDYCFACVYQGLNDAGCYDCSRTVTHQTPSKLSLCQKQTQYAMSIPGRFTPQCNDDGSYASMQCHGSTGYCWCVDSSSGQEIANTRQAPGSIPNCARAGLSACQLQATQASFGYGGFRPRCEVDGSYSPMQCHGSTGYCWCVDSHGVEITNTRVPPGTMANCTAGVYQLSACQNAVESAAHIIGAYIPQCEADGTFSSLQCHGSTGYCWCVDKDGNEIDGSRKAPGDMPACSVYSTSPCLLQQSQTGRGIGSFRPQCEDDGTYAKMQCHGSTGYCWCVDTQTGVEVNGTRVPPGTMANCDSNLRLSKCQSEVSSAATVFGAFVPQCAEDGSYSALQCHGSTGYCWCVSNDGTEIPGTRQGPGIVVDCSSSSRTMSKALIVRDTAVTPCLSQAKQASRGYGSFRPQCEADGSFSRLQCHPSTGYCWCVEQSTGKAIDSSRRGPGNVPDCDSFDGSNQQLSACQLQVSQSTHLLGSYVPQCEADGSYSSLQCHPSTGYCWCVDSNGQEIVNTRKGPGRVVDCTAATLTPCQLQQKQSSHGYGSFAPQCNSDGSYNRVQCHASTGYCWCVQVNGVEVNGTRVPPGSVPDCSASSAVVLKSKPVAAAQGEATPCEQVAASGAGQIGAYVPQCEEDGSYSALQCWSSTGYCWCVNSTGGEFENSRARFRVPDCDLFLLSPCLLQRKQASPGFGSFRPRCEADGSYSSLQCHGSTGYCWCVSPDGKEIANTRVGPGGAPSCDSVFKPARNVLIARALMP